MVTVAQFLRFITRRELACSIDVPKETDFSRISRVQDIFGNKKKKKGNGRIERFHGSKVRDITKSSNAVISIVAVCVRIRRSVAPTRLITRPAKIFSKSLPVTVSVVVTVNAVTKNSFGFRTVRGTCVVIQPMISGSRRTHS